MIELQRGPEIGSSMATVKVFALDLAPLEKLVWLVAAATLYLDADRLAKLTGLAPVEVSDIIDRTWHLIEWVEPV